MSRQTAFPFVAVLSLVWPGLGDIAAAADPPQGSRMLEGAFVPLVGGDTDIGIGAGVLVSLARLDPTRQPFRWRLEGAAFGTVKPIGTIRPLRDLELKWPYQDVFLVFTRNGLFSERLRFELRASYTRETDLLYYGIGNASVRPPDDMPARDFFTRTHPAGRARARIALSKSASVVVGSVYTFSKLAYDAESRLAQDLQTGSPQLRELLQVDPSHAVHLIEGGFLFDTRDDEIAPQRGQFHQLEVRLAPWQSRRYPHRYAELHLTSRFYQRIVTNRLVLAARAVGYLQVGDVPFYELARYDETSALGGAKGVRGVPKNRYYGKRKVFGNIEARARLFNFRMGKKNYQLGLVGFFDGGRVWADLLKAAPELDGTGWGLKYGAGGGLRLQKGSTFVLRVDLAWSPDARPVGGYFLAGHLF